MRPPPPIVEVTDDSKGIYYPYIHTDKQGKQFGVICKLTPEGRKEIARIPIRQFDGLLAAMVMQRRIPLQVTRGIKVSQG